MSRLKFLPLLAALAAVSTFGTSCGSSNTKLRIVQAIPDVPSQQPLDIYIDGSKAATSVGFEGLFPSSGYHSTSGGSRHVQVYLAGQTTNPYLDATVSLSNGTEYTQVLTGSVTSQTVVAPLLTDNNTKPSNSGDFELRVIHAAPTWNNFFGGMDVYVVAPGTNISTVSPTMTNVTFKSASGYQPAAAGTYEVIMTPVGSKSNDIDVTYTFTAGQIRTLVVVDAAGGGFSGTPLELNDLN